MCTPFICDYKCALQWNIYLQYDFDNLLVHFLISYHSSYVLVTVLSNHFPEKRIIWQIFSPMIRDPMYVGIQKQGGALFDNWYRGSYKLVNERFWTTYVSHACECIPVASWAVLTCRELLCWREETKDGNCQSERNEFGRLFIVIKGETLPQ